MSTTLETYLQEFEQIISLKFKIDLKLVPIQQNDLLSLESITSIVCAVAGETVAEVRGKSRARHLIPVRHISMYLLDKYSKFSQKEIGEYFNADSSNCSYIKTVVIPNARDTNDATIMPLLNKTESIVKQLHEKS